MLGTGAPARLPASLAAIDVPVVVIFAFGGNLWLVFLMLWVRVIGAPVQLAGCNRNFDSASRAMVIPMSSQISSIGQVAGGPALGWVGSAVSIRAARLAAALVLSPTIALYHRMSVRNRRVSTSAPA